MRDKLERSGDCRLIVYRSTTGVLLSEKDRLVTGYGQRQRMIGYCSFHDSCPVESCNVMPVAREAIPTAEFPLHAKRMNCCGFLPKSSFRTHDARIRCRKHDSWQVVRGIAAYRAHLARLAGRARAEFEHHRWSRVP